MLWRFSINHNFTIISKNAARKRNTLRTSHKAQQNINVDVTILNATIQQKMGAHPNRHE